MKAFWRCCCPCCFRGEPEEKPRVKVSYGDASSPKQAPEETVALLKPEEQHHDAINENGSTKKEKGEEPSDQNKHDEEKEEEPSDTKQEDDKESDKKNDGTGEVMKGNVERNTDTDNGKGTKTVTTATMKTSSVGESRNSTRKILEDAQNKSNRNEDEETEIVEYVDKYGRRVRRRIVKKIVTTTITTKKGSGEDGSASGKKDGDSYSSVYKTSVMTKKTDGDENRREFERSTTSSDDKNPIVVVKTDRKIDMPDWMEESKSPRTKRQNLDSSDISIHLKYPTNDVAGKKEPGEKVQESKIQAEVAKRDTPDISIDDLEDVLKQKQKEKPEVKKTEKEIKPTPSEPTPDDDDDDENEDDEEEEGEYDEFEEEIVIIEVSRKYRFPKGMEAPKPQPEKPGIPIEDLLEIPTMQIEQESTPDDKPFMEEEDIESTERPPIVFSEPDWTLLDEL